MKRKILLILILFTIQMKGADTLFYKPLLDFELWNKKVSSYIKLEKKEALDSLNLLLIRFVIDPTWIENDKSLNNFIGKEIIYKLKVRAQIQKDWNDNRYNKDVEDFFKSIQVLDQKYRWDLQNCLIKTKNKDSCWKAFPIVSIIDSLNILSIDSFIQLYGYPKQKWAGDGFNSFTLVYYRHNVKNLKNDILLIENAYRLKFVKKRAFISLYDTYLLITCQNQKYKTWDCFSKKQNKKVPCTPCLMNRERCNCSEDEE